MRGPLSVAFFDCSVVMDEFQRRATAACQDINDTAAKHRELIAESRELLAKVNSILERDRKIFGGRSAYSAVACS